MQGSVGLRLFRRLVLILVIIFAVWPSQGAGRRADKEQRTIQLMNCRVKLIDRVTLASDRAGIIKFVAAQEGDVVQAGAEVIKLKSDKLTATRNIAEQRAKNDVQIRYARKATEVAHAEYAKAIQANRNVPGTIPDVEVLRLKLAAEGSVLQIEEAEHDAKIQQLTLEEVDAELSTYRVIAPFEGVVTRVYKSVGEAVAEGAPILDVVDTRRVRVEGEMGIRDMWNVQQGNRVTVQLVIPDLDLPVEQTKFQGRLIFVDVTVHPVTQTVRVWAEVENNGQLLREGLAAKMVVYPNTLSPTRTAQDKNLENHQSTRK